MGQIVTAQDFMTARAARTSFRTQEDCIRFAVQTSIATLGPVYQDDETMRAAVGIATGLFGDAFDQASPVQQQRWVDVCHYEYRKAVGLTD